MELNAYLEFLPVSYGSVKVVTPCYVVKHKAVLTEEALHINEFPILESVRHLSTQKSVFVHRSCTLE